MKIKNSLIVYLQQRIVLFSLDSYINILLIRIFNKMHEWELISAKKITGKEKYFKFFAEKEILDVLNEIKTLYKSLNLKIFTFCKLTKIELKEEFLAEDNCVLKILSNLFKKICKKYFLDKIPDNVKFYPSDKMYKGLKCGEPTGEELEFLVKISKK